MSNLEKRLLFPTMVWEKNGVESEENLAKSDTILDTQ